MKKTYTKKQITEAISYWKKRLNESITANSIASDIKKALDTIVNTHRNRFSKTAVPVHVGLKGFYIGDVCDVKEDNGTIVLEIKQKYRNGLVEGGLTAIDIINKLNTFGNKPVTMRIPYDTVSRKLRGKDYKELKIDYIDGQCMSANIASVSGIWIRPIYI